MGLKDAWNWAVDKGEKYTPIGIASKKAYDLINPPKPEDPSKSPAGTATSNFAQGLADDRASFQQTPAGNVVEGGAPPAGFDPAALQLRDKATRDKMAADRAAQVYADPTGYDAQKRALALQEAAANGTAPSQAENLFRKASDEGMANQISLAAATQGSNPGLSQRAGLRGAADVGAGAASGAAALRADEMARARDSFATGAATTRGQTNQLAESNVQAKLQALGINNSFYLGLTDEQRQSLASMMQAAEANSKNQNDYNLGQQAFWGKLGEGFAKGAGGGGAA